MNSYISNFRKALIAALCLTFIAEFASLSILSVTLQGARQVVQFKRDIARKQIFTEEDAKDKKIVLFFGNSQISAGIVPGLFDDESGDKTLSFNFALPGTPFAPQFFLFKDYLVNNPSPDYIVMSFDDIELSDETSISYSVQGASLTEAMKLWIKYRNTEILSQYFIPSRYHWPRIENFFIGKLLEFLPDKIRNIHKKGYISKHLKKETYPHDWDQLYDSRFNDFNKNTLKIERSLLADRGYYYIEEQAVKGGSLNKELFSNNSNDNAVPMPNNKIIKYDPPKKTFTDDFFKLVIKNNIKVLFINTYTFSEKGDNIDSNARTTSCKWTYFKNKYPNNVFFSGDGSMKVYGCDLFSDPTHLNPKGADMYTRDIYLELKGLIWENS
ncbi:MAG: DUF1574 family protein [Candidatus Omnitrophica bacterium]|nr:DUF1574 family protein [Candidatus Omnitrophota bacterium]